MLRKTAIILGGNGDIGAEAAKTFAKAGYNIAVTYFETHKELKQEILAENVLFYEERVDLTKICDVERFFKNLKKTFDSLDVLVCGQGLSASEKLLIDASYDEILRLVDVNLTSAILCCKEALKIFMPQKYGNIILISSIYGISGGSCESVYSACKAGLLGLCKSLVTETAGQSIRINCVCPGCIETKMTKNILATEKKKIEEKIPLKRVGRPCDVANVCKFLASEDSAYVNGAVIEVDGGAFCF